MIAKLRRRLILVSMLSLFLVLFLVIGVAGGIGYHNLTEDADSTLSLLAENGGVFPGDVTLGGIRPANPGEPPERDGGAKEPEPREEVEPGFSAPDSADTENAAGSPRPAGRRRDEASPEFPFEIRYFSADFDASGGLLSVTLDHIYAVDEAGAADYGERVLESGRRSGFIDQYRYLVDSSDEGKTIYFLDCWRNLRDFRRFSAAGIVGALLGMGAVFVLISFFSGRIVRPIAESYDKQRRFVTDAGHDIKTPLSIINADAELLEMDIGKPNEWLSDIKVQSRRLSELTDDLITLSKLEETDSMRKTGSVAFSEMVSETSKHYQAIACGAGDSYTEDIAPGIVIKGDEKMLGRCLDILFDNAVKYCSPGGAVSLNLSERGAEAVMSLCNSTDSVSEEDIPHLFERFYRTDKSRNSETGGYGIGLSIAEGIVSMHRGRIEAATDGESLTMTVTLPKDAR